MIGEDAPIRDGVCLTPLERRLARRIHNQRRRLAQMEMFHGWQRKTDVLNAYRKTCRRLMDENARLRNALEAIAGGLEADYPCDIARMALQPLT